MPQGSVLSPFVFVSYINELLHLTRYYTRCVPIMFADDDSILFTNNGKNKLQYGKNKQYDIDINNALKGLTTWLKSLNL